MGSIGKNTPTQFLYCFEDVSTMTCTLYVTYFLSAQGQDYAKEGNVNDTGDCQFETQPKQVEGTCNYPSASGQPEPSPLQI